MTRSPGEKKKKKLNEYNYTFVNMILKNPQARTYVPILLHTTLAHAEVITYTSHVHVIKRTRPTLTQNQAKIQFLQLDCCFCLLAMFEGCLQWGFFPSLKHKKQMG